MPDFIASLSLPFQKRCDYECLEDDGALCGGRLSARRTPRSPCLLLSRHVSVKSSLRVASADSENSLEERPCAPRPSNEFVVPLRSLETDRTGFSVKSLRKSSTENLLDWDPVEAERPRCGSLGNLLSRFVIIPDDRAWWLRIWDIVIVAGLLVVAIYEPYALGLVDIKSEPWYCILLNRVLDFIFTVDMALHFFIAYPRTGSGLHEDTWETNPVMIAKRYCGCVPFIHSGSGGWFWIDLLAVFPGWINVARILAQDLGATLDTATLAAAGENIRWLLMLRILRLFYLTRFNRISKLIESWHTYCGFPFYIVEVSKFIAITTLTCHWMACIWCMVEGRITHGMRWGFLSSQTDQPTWLTALIESKGDSCFPGASENPGCVYLIAFYWATTTLTSVGYGDITPQNQTEYVVGTICMTIIAYVWAYIVGSIVSILSNIDPHTASFKQNVDCLNQLMEKRGLPHELRLKLRTYLNSSREFARDTDQRQLMERIVSRGLQLEVAAKSPEVQSILRNVFWVKDLEEPAILEIVRALQPNSYGPREIVNLPETMIVIHKGIAGVCGKILSRGQVWGAADVLLDTPQLKHGVLPCTITYVELFMLTKKSLLEVCKAFPRADQRIRRAQIRTAVARAFVRAAEKMKRNRYAIHHSSRAPQLVRTGSGALGSFVYPGVKYIDLAASARQGEDDIVDLPELKRLLVQVRTYQESSARDAVARDSVLETRLEHIWQNIHDCQDANGSGSPLAKAVGLATRATKQVYTKVMPFSGKSGTAVAGRYGR